MKASLTQGRHIRTVPSMSMSHLPDLLTVAEVAKVLRVSDETIHRWCREGRLQHVPNLPLKRFRRDYIEALVAGEEPPAPEAQAS